MTSKSKIKGKGRTYALGLVASGLFFLGSVQISPAAIVSMQALLNFALPGTMKTNNDVVFGGVHPQPNDIVTVNTNGKTSLNGTGSVYAPDSGHAGDITIKDSDNQNFNIWPFGSQAGAGVSGIQPLCSING